MNTKKIDITENKGSEKCGPYLARGALIWGPIYTTGVSGMAYAIVPSILGDALAYSNVLPISLIICPWFGAAGGYLHWRLIGPEPVDAAGSETPKRDRTVHRFWSRRKTAHRKAA